MTPLAFCLFPSAPSLEEFPFSLQFLCSAFGLGEDALAEGNGNNFDDFNGIRGADGEFPGLLMGTDCCLLVQHVD